MGFNNFLNSIAGKTPSEMQAEVMKMYTSMPPDRFFEHMNNLQSMAEENGREKEREEIVCRLLASGMTAEEITVILCAKADAIRLIEQNNTAIKIPEYAKKLKERQRRRQALQ